MKMVVSQIHYLACSVEIFERKHEEDKSERKILKTIESSAIHDDSECVESLSGVLLSESPSLPHSYVLSILPSTLKVEEVGGNKNVVQTNFEKSNSTKVMIRYCNPGDPKFISTQNAKPMFAWKCRSFANCLEKLFSAKDQWSFFEEDSESKITFDDMSWFVLYVINTPGAFINSNDCYANKYLEKMDGLTLTPGTSVLTRTFPFGSAFDIFSDAVSSGVICNITGQNGSLFLTDARCLPGSEGGVILSKGCPSLIGLIVVPLCWKTKELVGFTICCSLKEIIESLNSALSRTPPKFLSDKTDFVNFMVQGLIKVQWVSSPHLTMPDVLQIETGDTWGSGVVVAATVGNGKSIVYVMTCRHVIDNLLRKRSSSIRMYFQNMQKSYHGNLIFTTLPASCFDLALLSFTCDRKMVNALNLERLAESENKFVAPHISNPKEFCKGGCVYVKGHGLFDTNCGIGPTITSGMISTIACVDAVKLPKSCSVSSQWKNADHVPVLLHSTCLVHKGVSGGALVSSESGLLQGIVVNHVRDETSKVSYPDVNFSIPSTVFMPAVIEYITTRNQNALSYLNCTDKEISRIWSLGCPTHEKSLQSKL